MPPVKLTWFDGGLTPPEPVELGEEQLKKEGGAIIIGSKGKLMYDTYGANPRLLPKSLQDSVKRPLRNSLASTRKLTNSIRVAAAKVTARPLRLPRAPLDSRR